MQANVETLGALERRIDLTVPAADIEKEVSTRLTKLARTVRMPGFRPGKVPANLVKKMHGAQLHQEALNTAIRESMDKLVADNKLRPAMQPDVSLGEGYDEGKDAVLTVELEVLPQIEAPSLDGLKLEKLTVPVTEAEVDEAVARIGAGQKSFTDAKKGAKAKDGDQIIIDFAVRGRVGGGLSAGARLQVLHPRFRGSAGRRQGR